RDDRWNRHRSRLEGLPAQIVQHEMDHFEGKLV
ncbi:peptide deformylase, partial [Faecalibaculum rodentium]